MIRLGSELVCLPHSHRVSSSFRSQKLICKLRLRLSLRLLMILVSFSDDSASDCLQHKFEANCLNGRNTNVRTAKVQLDPVANTNLLAIKIDNCFKTIVPNIEKRLGLLKRTDKFL